MARQTKQSSAAELNTAQPSITASETTPSQSGSLTKGLAILEVLATSDKPLGVTDIALIMDTAKSGVHRLLQTLRSTGWVSKTPEGRYECTLRLWEFGMRLGDRVDLKRVAVPAMKILAATTQEAVHLSILDKADVLYIDKIDSPQPVRAYTSIGSRSPAYAVATGKVLLAFSDPQTVLRATRSMQAFSQHTLTTRDALNSELQRIRETGYAINRGEWRETVCGLAAPIFDRRNQLVGAIGISGPAERLTLRILKGYAPDVIAAARDISANLGHHDSALAK